MVKRVCELGSKIYGRRRKSLTLGKPLTLYCSGSTLKVWCSSTTGHKMLSARDSHVIPHWRSERDSYILRLRRKMSSNTAYSYEPVKLHLEKLLNQRQYPKTICPSEAARALSTDEITATGASSWRDLMPLIREEIFKMRDEQVIEILQGGEIVPQDRRADEVKGPIRLRLSQQRP